MSSALYDLIHPKQGCCGNIRISSTNENWISVPFRSKAGKKCFNGVFTLCFTRLGFLFAFGIYFLKHPIPERIKVIQGHTIDENCLDAICFRFQLTKHRVYKSGFSAAWRSRDIKRRGGIIEVHCRIIQEGRYEFTY